MGIPEFNVLILGPGGVKGFLEIGALLALEKRKIIKAIDTFVGVSVGSIICCLLSSGFSVNDIIGKAVNIDLFGDVSNISLTGAKQNTGLISNERIRKELENSMREKFGYVPSLKQHYLATGKQFVSVVSNLSKRRPEYLSYKTDPEFSIVDAVLLSMNIPLLFYRMRYNNCTYIDGAFTDPFPIRPYDDGKNKIIIITVDSDIDANTNEDIIKYLHDVIHSSMASLKTIIIQSKSNNVYHINIPYQILDITGITISDDNKAQMIAKGYDETSAYINNLENPNLEYTEVVASEMIEYEGDDTIPVISKPMSPRKI